MAWSRPGLVTDGRGHPGGTPLALASSAEPGSEPRPETRNKDEAMEIEGTTFGTITIDGKTYEHDVVIRLSGEVVKRKKKLSKKYYGTRPVILNPPAECSSRRRKLARTALEIPEV
jgi:hypothetical protein